MGKIKTYNNEIIDRPNNDIKIFGSILNQPLYLTLIDSPKTGKDNKIIIFDNARNTLLYKCNKTRSVILDSNDNVFVTISKYFTCKKIYYGDDKSKNSLAKIKYLEYDSKTKNNVYSVKIYNQATESDETLYMYYDYYNASCGIYQGNSKEETSPLIAKVVELIDANSFVLDTRRIFSIEIAPNVDIALIIGLIVNFAIKNHDSQYLRHT